MPEGPHNSTTVSASFGWRIVWQRMVLGAWLSLLFAATSSAGPFSQLVVFGDSLSDIGNLSDTTFGIYPGPYYTDDRFSNGPVYVEALATGLGLPLTTHGAGGNNFAYGGAKTFGTGGFEGLFIRDIDEQVDLFVADRVADPNALFIVFAGSNDLVGGQTNMSTPIGSLADDLDRLIDEGARNFLVPNLPLLGHTPRYNNNPTTLATYNTRTEQFNSALTTMLDDLEAEEPEITVYRFDTAGLFSQVLANPAAYGFTNVTQAAAPGLQPGASSYNTSQIAPNPNEYMFWDDLHPTATVHAILAQEMLDLFTLQGDFNDDGTVDAADYVVWKLGLETIYTQTDYDVWLANFGQTAGGGDSSIGTVTARATIPFVVPEPCGWLLIAASSMFAFGWRRSR